MTRLRSLLFAGWMYGWMLILAVVFIPSVVLPRSVLLVGIRLWIRITRFGLRTICGVRVHIRGRENLVGGPVLIASKHQAMLDTLIPFLFLKDPCFVLKKELLWYPVFGWYLAKADMIPIDRDGSLKTLKAMTDTAKRQSAKGREIVIFPEGTRKLPGEPADYKPGVALLYKELGFPCVPIALDTGRSWPARGIDRTPGDVTFDILPVIPANQPRKAFMETLEHRIEQASSVLLAERCATSADQVEVP